MTTTTAPPTARKKPQDRKPTRADEVHDAQLAEERLLASVPPMKDPARLPFRSRGKILILSTRLKNLSGDDGTLTIDPDDVDRMTQFLDLIADFAGFARTITTEPDQWDAWEENATYEQIGALLAKYGRAVGESTGSSS